MGGNTRVVGLGVGGVPTKVFRTVKSPVLGVSVSGDQGEGDGESRKEGGDLGLEGSRGRTW